MAKRKKKVEEKLEAIKDPYEALIQAHEAQVKDTPVKPVDSLLKESQKLQQTLRKNQFHNKTETVKVSAELLAYFNEKRLDKYNHTLVIG